MKQADVLTHVTHVNGWFPAVYMSYMLQNYHWFHVSNLSVLNFQFFSAHVSVHKLRHGLANRIQTRETHPCNQADTGRRPKPARRYQKQASLRENVTKCRIADRLT